MPLLLLGLIVAPPPVLRDGCYLCQGTLPDGGDYASIVLVRREGDAYLVRWVSDREQTVDGVGVLDGDRLVIGFAAMADGQLVRGVSVLRLRGGDALEGCWTLAPGDGKLHRESWSRFRDLPRPKERL